MLNTDVPVDFKTPVYDSVKVWAKAIREHTFYGEPEEWYK